jgi:hypothetical protein
MVPATKNPIFGSFLVCCALAQTGPGAQTLPMKRIGIIYGVCSLNNLIRP